MSEDCLKWELIAERLTFSMGERWKFGVALMKFVEDLCYLLYKRFSPVLFWLTGITQVGLYAGTTRVRVLLDLCIWDLFGVSTAFLKWAASCKNVSSGTWGQRRPRSACTESLAAIESNNARMKPCACAGWCESAHFAHARRYSFAWFGPM